MFSLSSPPFPSVTQVQMLDKFGECQKNVGEKGAVSECLEK